jgi:7SK snRNA methylphosphate capping enzyme
VESASVASAATPDQQTVEFFCEDWATSKNDKTSGPFDVILALNVVKWIHLQHLDQGLETFFRKCASSLKAGGYFVIEVQPWKSYLSAIHPKKAPHFKGNLELLKHRPETSYTELLEQNGLIHVATSEELPRRISVYRKEEELRGGLTSGDPE